MFIKGFRFGMLLQLAIGPVCIYIFQSSINYGFSSAFMGALGVTFIDALYIMLAIYGLGNLIEKNKMIKKILGYFGGIILLIFGVASILGIFGINILPSIKLFSKSNSSNVLFNVILLTLSNPLTILFWTGVFSARLTEVEGGLKDFYLFGLGSILSTLFFLGGISILGSKIGLLFNQTFMNILNLVVGFAIVIFGLKTLTKLGEK